MCVWSQTLHHFYLFLFFLLWADSWQLVVAEVIFAHKGPDKGLWMGSVRPVLHNQLQRVALQTAGIKQFSLHLWWWRVSRVRLQESLWPCSGNPLRFYALVLFSLWRFDTSLSDQFPLEIHTFKMVLKKKKSRTSDISDVNQTSCWRTTNNTVVVSWWKRCGFDSRQNDFGKSCASCLQSTLLVLPCTNRKPWVHTFPSPAFYGEI